MSDGSYFDKYGHAVERHVDGVYEQRRITYTCRNCDLERVSAAKLRGEPCIVGCMYCDFTGTAGEVWEHLIDMLEVPVVEHEKHGEAALSEDNDE